MQLVKRRDESGDLLVGAFWELVIKVNLGIEVDVLDEEYISPPLPPVWNRGSVCGPFAEVLSKTDEVHDCPLHKEHVTSYVHHGFVADLSGTIDSSTSLLPDGNGGPDYILGTGRVKALLEDSNLRGWRPFPIPVEAAQPDSSLEGTILWGLRFTGAECVREPIWLPPEPNVCPLCGHGPILCTACGVFAFYCTKCRKAVCVNKDAHDGFSDPRYVMDARSSCSEILEGRDWDGSDFIPGYACYGFVTSRVVRWLLQNDLSPFSAWPARVDLTGTTKEQREAIEELASIDVYSGEP